MIKFLKRTSFYSRRFLSIATLFVVSVLIFGTQLINIFFIKSNEDFSRQINLVGRQRMLSQKIAKEVLSLDSTQLSLLHYDVISWEKVHYGLLNGDPELHVKAVSDRNFRQQLVRATPHLDAIAKGVANFSVDAISAHQLTDLIQNHEKPFLDKMDSILYELVTESEHKSYLFEFVEISLTIISSAILVIGFFFGYRPIYKKIKTQEYQIKEGVCRLTELNNNLENKLEELANANKELQTAEEELRIAHEEQIDLTKELENRVRLNDRYINQLAAAQETAGIGYWSYDLQEKMIWSEQMFSIFGLPQKTNGIGPTLEEFHAMIHPEDVEIFALKASEANEGNKVRYKMRIYKQSGEMRYIDSVLKKQVGANGEVLGIFGVTRDITDDENIKKTLIDAKETAENAAKIKQDFLANISHEIRTPMNAILGFTRLLLQTKQEKESEEYLQAIYDSADTLLVVINDILDFSKIQSGKFTIEKVHFNLRKMLTAQQKLFSVKVDESDIQLIFDTDKKLPNALQGDPTRISQVLNNLINNAIKFTKKGFVKVSTSIVENIGNEYYLKIDVQDTGIGISEEKHDAIFNSFEQERGDTTRLHGGTGLGLTIVKKLIELMDGSISLQSQEGKGAIFTVLLKLELGDESKIVSDSLQLNSLDLDQLIDTRILLVEDNRNNQILATKCLTEVGCSIDIASNGKEAIEILETRHYDLVLMDVQMPVMDGIQATKIIKTKPHPICDIPIVAMTAHALKEEEKQYKAVGMCGYVSKPFVPKQLYSILINVLQGKTWNINDEGKQSVIRHEEPTDVEAKTEMHMKQENKTKAPEYGEELDFKALHEIAGGDQEFIDTMLNVFLEDAPGYLRQLEVAKIEKDWVIFKKSAHTLKSSVMFLGLNQTMRFIEEIDCMNVELMNESKIESAYLVIHHNIQYAISKIRDLVSSPK